MKVIYIAGKYTGNKHSEINDNIEKAEAVAIACCVKGWCVLTPHKNFAHFEKYENATDKLDYNFWMNATEELLKRSDAIIMLPNWEDSKGATHEFNFANDNNIPVFYAKNGIPDPDDVQIS